ncbi:hypothetical protein JYT87_01070 [Nitrospira defluvii]|nr:hypothetical protein [Nitrospira defluvii]
MKKIFPAVIALIIAFSFIAPRLASAKHEKKGKTKGIIVEVQGDLIKAEGEGTVTVKDRKGKLHKFQFDQTTLRMGRLAANTGVKIEVKSEKGGHAKSVMDKKQFEEEFMPDFLTMTPHFKPSTKTEEERKKEEKELLNAASKAQLGIE